ncbi:uncharacterized protein LOC129756319 [Uranotaenia lowii]|uniref:uncharacterized protein LOC129756319 n=1 Tax=Uranotaenia lowii TaxID=190385 RepID=UPI00247981E7|nr:uncharacterized protein LOC129756319 [Uranotaenia lowii]
MGSWSSCCSLVGVGLTLLLGIGLIGQGIALECNFCIGINACNVSAEELDKVECTEKIVELTNRSLATFIPPLAWVERAERDQYQCIHVRATSLTDTTFLFVRGCIFAPTSVDFCDLRYASFRGTRECVACEDEDLCNDVLSSGVNHNWHRSSVVWITLIAILVSVINPTINQLCCNKMLF